MNWDTLSARTRTNVARMITVANCGRRTRWNVRKRRKVSQKYDQPFANLKLMLDNIGRGNPSHSAIVIRLSRLNVNVVLRPLHRARILRTSIEKQVEPPKISK